MTTETTTAYEVLSQSFKDLNLEQQIKFGICNWCAEGKDGRPYFGRTQQEAEAIRFQYEGV